MSLIRLIQFNRGKHIFRSLMIGVQLAVCVFFLGAVMVVHLSYTELFGKTYVPLDTERIRQHWDEIRSGLAALPEIERLVTLGDETLDGNLSSYLYTSYQKADHSEVRVAVAQGDPAYFDFSIFRWLGNRWMQKRKDMCMSMRILPICYKLNIQTVR